MRVGLNKAIAAIAVGLLLASPAAAQTARFDGTWSVEVVTEKGACDQAYRYSIVVENGRARYGGREAFDIDGQVRPNGAVSARIARGQDHADVVGRLADGFGSGTWMAVGSRTCSGRWNAEKRG
jgi:hypothetical protein